MRQRACVLRYQSNDKAVQREAEALLAAGYDVDVLELRSPRRSGEPRQPRLETINGVRYTRVGITKRRSSPRSYVFNWGCWFAAGMLWLTAQTIRRRFHYVQIDTLPDHQVFTAVIPRLTGARIGLFCKEPTEELYGALWGSACVASLMGWLAQRSIAFAHVVFCVTEEHRRAYIDRGVDPDRLHVVLNSMPPFPKAVRQRSLQDGRFVVVCHGTIEDRWGHDTIIEAAALARRDIPGLRVHLPGRGESSDRLQTRIADMRLEDVVSLDGWLADDELAQLLADADVGLVAQLANPYSHLVHTTKMFDFMQAGVPVIASRLHATQALFPDEFLYVDSGSAEQLADALTTLAGDPDRRQQLAASALARLDALGWKQQMNHMVAAVNRVVHPQL